MATGSSGGSLTTNKNYLVSMSRQADGLSIIGNAQAKLGIQIENKWQNILEALGLTSDTAPGILGAAIAGAQLTTGNNFLPTIATSQVWRGSSGIELQLEFRFDAWNDAFQDVLQPVQNLVRMYSPTRGSQGAAGIASAILGTALGNLIGNSFLSPPGPTPYSYAQSGGNDPMTIQVMLGRVMTIKNMIPVNLRWEFENRFTAAGDPVCALVQCSLMSYTIPSQQEILSFFLNTGGAAPSPANGPAAVTPSTNPNATPATGAIPIVPDVNTNPGP